MRFKHNTIRILIIFQFIFICSCRTSKIDEGKDQFLFTGTKYKYLDNKSKPYSDELDNYVKQKANKEVLIVMPLPLWVYNFSNSKFDTIYREYYNVSPKLRNQSILDSLYIKYNQPKYVGKSRWLDRFFYKNGEAPVLVNLETTGLSAKNLQQYFVNRGWRKAMVKDTIFKGKKKADVRYDISLGEPTMVKAMTYTIDDSFIERLYASFLKNSYLKEGKRLDVYQIQNDISQFEERLKNLGYYQFNDLKDEMIYEVDTANRKKTDSIKLDIHNVLVNLKIQKSIYDQKIADSLAKDSLVPKFHRYTYEKINVTLAEENKDAANYNGNEEGTLVNGYNIINRSRKYNNRVLTDMMAIYQWNEEEKSEQKLKQKELSDKLKQLGEKIGKDKARERMGDKWYKWFKKYREGFYSLNDEVETRRNIYKVNNFNILKFNTEKLSDSTLKTDILLVPMDKYSYEIGFDAFSSRVANYGITPNVTFTVKNLFGGAENLSLGFSGSLGNIESKKDNNKLFNASEFSVYSSLTFPRLLLPFDTRKVIPKGWGPSSMISVGYNAQYNIGLDRRNYTTAISYGIQPQKSLSHQLTLWNLQYTQFLNPNNYFNIYDQDALIRDRVYKEYFNVYPDLGKQYADGEITDNDLLTQIQDNYSFQNILQNSDPILFDDYNLLESRRYRFTQNVLISSLIYRLVYDQRLGSRKKNPLYINAGVEIGGNVLSLFNKALNDFTTTNGKVVKGVFGVPYSQFVRFDLDLVKTWKIGYKKTLNYRFFTGIGIPYGNSFTLPFDRNFSVGGPSDVRAWRAFGFGPGTSKLGSKQGFELVALENFKLLTSVEYRFPLTEKGFEGAFFVDAGNIWSTRKNTVNKFYFDSFYKELGIGGGAGIRWDISNFIIRFDFAYKFHDPTREEGDRWSFKRINVIKPQFNFAIGYPF